MPELEARGFETHLLRLNTGHRALPVSFWRAKFGARDAVLLDGAEQLWLMTGHRVHHHLRGAGAFIITTHRPRLLPTWLLASTSPALRCELVQKLGAHCSLEEAQTFFAAHKGNLRGCLFALYEASDNSRARGARPPA